MPREMIARYHACERCRKHKAKCNGGEPVCERCCRLKYECSYPGKRRRIEASRSVSPRRRSGGDVAAKSRGQRLPSIPPREESPAGVQLAMITTSNASEPLPGDSEIPLEWTGESFWEPDFLQFLLGGDNPLDQSTFLTPMIDLEPKTLLPINLDLPSPNDMESIERFFDLPRNTHYIPFIHKRLFMNEFLQGKGSTALVYAIRAFSSMDVKEAIQLVDKARDVIDENVRKLQDLYRTVQALILIIILQSTGCLLPRSKRADTYLLCGEAIRLCTLLSLNHEPSPASSSHSSSAENHVASPKSPLELEERRRTFWYCHVCCLISSNLDLWTPVILPDSEITVSYPIDEEIWLAADESTPLPKYRAGEEGETWSKRFVTATSFVAAAAGTLNISQRRNPPPSPAEVTYLSNEIASFREHLSLHPFKSSNNLPISIATLPIAFSYFASTLLHLPRSHPTNPKCPHWQSCLEIVKQAIPTLQPLFSQHNTSDVTHPLASLSLYLIARLLLDEMSLREDPFGFIENTVRAIIDKFASVHQGSVITLTQARYAAHLSTTLHRVKAGDGVRREKEEGCPCVGGWGER